VADISEQGFNESFKCVGFEDKSLECGKSIAATLRNFIRDRDNQLGPNFDISTVEAAKFACDGPRNLNVTKVGAPHCLHFCGVRIAETTVTIRASTD
jgi:hypothetical protein